MSLNVENEAGREINQADSTTESMATAASPQAGSRVVSVDTLRGLTILLMVFVNDLGRGAAAWMHHIRPPLCRRDDPRRHRFPVLPLYCGNLDPAGSGASGNSWDLTLAAAWPHSAAVRRAADSGIDRAQQRRRPHAWIGPMGHTCGHLRDPGLVRDPPVREAGNGGY